MAVFGSNGIGLRALLLRLLLVPFLLSQGLAPGTMLADGANGVAVVLCSGTGPLTLILGPDGTPVPADSDPSHDSAQAPCPWSGAAPPLVLGPAPTPVRIASVGRRVARADLVAFRPRRIAVLAPPARAPPVRA